MDNKKRKNLIAFLLLALIFICIICIVLIVILKNNKDDGFDEGVEGAKTEYVVGSLDNNIKFFTVEKCVQTYIDNVNNSNWNAVYDELAKSYIEENNIKTNNVSNFITAFPNTSFKATKMNILGDSLAENYAVYGYFINNEQKEYYCFKVKIDTQNITFEITPYSKTEYTKIDDIVLIEDNTGIEENSNNKFEYELLTSDDVATKYWEDYKENALNFPVDAYNLLDEEYREKRFENLEGYISYLNEMHTKIEADTISKYTVNKYDKYTEYIFTDVYQNTYTVKVSAVMDYTITLDNYTVKTDYYTKQYNNSSNEEKAMANAKNFIMMVNNKDYKHIYELLADSFKTNYFPTYAIFEEYAKSNFLGYNIVVDSSISSENNNYICTITVKDGAGRVANKQTINAIIRLGEGTDFVMSFSIE